MPDVFDQVSPSSGTGKSQGKSSSGDVFDQAGGGGSKMDTAFSDAMPGPLKGVARFMEGGSNYLQKGLANVVGMLPGKLGEAGRTEASQIGAATTGAGKAGETAAQGLELLAPIPGVGKIQAAKGAGTLAKVGAGVVRGAVDTGLRAAADTGDKGAAVGAGLVGGAVEGAIAGAGPGSRMLKAMARKQYAKVLHPTGTAAKELTKDLLLNGGSRDLVSRGVVARTAEGLGNKLSSQAEQAGKAVDAAFDNLPPTAKTKIKPIMDGFIDSWQKHAVDPASGKVNKQLANVGFDMLNRMVNELGPYMDEVSPKSARWFKQTLDNELRRAKLKINPATDQTVVKNLAANAIRDVLNKQFPSVSAANAEYHFWNKADKIMQSTLYRKTGQQEVAKAMHRYAGASVGAAIGGAAGYEKGGKENAAEWALAGALLGQAFRSTAWRTVSPVVKDRIANLWASGKVDQAARIAARATGITVGREGRELKQ